MSNRWSIAWLVSLMVAFGWASVPVAYGQAFAHLLPPLYEFRDLRSDLDASGVEIPPDRLLLAYRDYIGAWHETMATARPNLERQVGLRFDVPPTESEAERGLQVMRQAESRAAVAEEALFAALAEALAEADRPKLERPKGWRRTLRATPVGVPGVPMLRLEDIGMRVRRLDLPAEIKESVLGALDATEAARRADLLQLKRDSDEGVLRAAKKLASPQNPAEGDGESRARGTGWREGIARGDLCAKVMASQWDAFEAVSRLLPAAERRTLTDTFFQRMVADQMQGSGLRFPPLPFSVRCPADLAWAVLSWPDLDPTKREATRAVVTEWIDRDDALVREHLKRTAQGLRSGETELASVGLPISLQRARGSITEEMLPKLIEASGADWLGEPTPKLPKLETQRLTPEDRALVGGNRAGPMTPNAVAVMKRRRAFLPDELDAEWVKRITEVGQLDGAQLATLEQLSGDYAKAWSERVAPHIDAVLRAEADLTRLSGEARRSERAEATLTEITAAVNTATSERLSAYAEMYALDAALFENLRVTSVEAAHPLIDAAEADRVIEPVVRYLLARHNSMEIVNADRVGGRMVNLAAMLRKTTWSDDLRSAVLAELAKEWPRLKALARELFDARLRALGVEQRAIAARFGDEPSDEAGGEKGADDLHSTDTPRRERAIMALADRWFEVEDGIVDRLLERASSVGDPNRSVRDLIESRRFPSVTQSVGAMDEVIAALEATTVEAGAKADAMAQLRAGREVVARLSRSWIDTCGKRAKLAERTEEEAIGVDTTRGWRSMDCGRASQELRSATMWYLRQRLPAETLANPSLNSVLR